MICAVALLSMLNLQSSFLQLLACPQDHTRLRAEDNNLVCEHRHRFSVEEGIPILIDNPRREPTPRNMEPCHIELGASVDPFVNDWLVNTNGNLYRSEEHTSELQSRRE